MICVLVKQIFDARQNIQGTRALRREKLARTGTNLAATLGAVKKVREKIPSQIADVLASAARESGIQNFGTQSFILGFPGQGKKSAMMRFNAARKGRSIHMLIGNRDLPKGAPGRVVALVGTWQDGKLMHMRRIHSR